MGAKTEELRVKFTGENSSYEAAINRNVAANAKLMESENKVKKHLGGMVADMTAAASTGDALAAGVTRLSEVFKVGLGAGVVVSVGAALKGEYDKLIADANRTADAMQTAYKRASNMDASGGMTDAVKSLREQAAQRANDADSAPDGWNRLLPQNWSKNIQDANAGLRGEPTLKAQAEGDSESLNNTAAAQEKIDRKADTRLRDAKTLSEITAKRATGENEIADKMQRQAVYAKEIREAEKTGIDGMKEAVQARQDAEEKGRQRTVELRKIELETQWKILTAQDSGYKVAVKTAQATLDAAKKRLDAENGSAQDKDAAGQQVMAAQIALKAAERSARLEAETLEYRKTAATVTGEEDDKRMAVLKAEEALLREKMNGASPDEKAGIGVDIASNAAAQTAAAKAAAERGIDVKSADIARGAGMGPTEELKAMQAQIPILRERLDLELQSANTDKLKVSSLLTQIDGANKAVAMKEAEKTIADSQFAAESKRLDLEASSASNAAKRYEATKLQLQATKDEVAALSKISPELARAATLKQKGLENDLADQDKSLNQGKTSGDIHARLKEQRKEVRENQKFQDDRAADSGLIDVKRDMDGNVTSGKNPVTGETETRAKKDSFDDLKTKGIDTKPRLADKMKEDTDKFRENFTKAKDDADTEAKAPDAPDASGSGKDSEEVAELKKLNKTMESTLLK